MRLSICEIIRISNAFRIVFMYKKLAVHSTTLNIYCVNFFDGVLITFHYTFIGELIFVPLHLQCKQRAVQFARKFSRRPHILWKIQFSNLHALQKQRNFRPKGKHCRRNVFAQL